MRCPRCNNTDPDYFYLGAKGYYCRKCIGFKRILLKEKTYPREYEISANYRYRLDYPLTSYQKTIAKECIRYIEKEDVLILAVTGSGKSEICMPIISHFLKSKKHVCFAIARREVVLELADRYQKAFKDSTVTKVCEGYNNILYADLIVCTTHQLYRYPKTFDLLILDEVDAFPFKGNEVLNNIAFGSLKKDGHIVYSTATVDEGIQKLMAKRPYKVLRLDRRPHGKPLIRPQIFFGPKVYLILRLCLLLKRSDRQMIIFVESIKICKNLYAFLKRFFNTTYVYSSLETRNENIAAFKDKKYKFIVATSVLERGITIPGVNVLILKLYADIFDKASLIQMSGRVGRSFDDPYGEVWILTTRVDEEIKNTIKEIDKANEVYIL